MVTRAAWLVLALTIAVLSAAAFPVAYRQVLSPCTTPDCLPFELVSVNRPTPAEVEVLGRSGFDLEHYARYQLSFLIFSNLVSLSVAAMLIWHRTDDRMAPLMAFAFLLWATFHPPAVYEALPHAIHGLLNLLLAVPYQVAWLMMFFLFPDGRFAPRWIAPLALARAAVLALGLVFSNTPFNRDHWPVLMQHAVEIFVMALAIYSQMHKYRHTTDPRRRLQTRWVVAAMAGVLLIGFSFAALLQSPPFSQPGLPRLLAYPLFTLVPAGIYLAFGAAILRYGLWGIRVIVTRTLTYLALTAVLTGIYIAAVSLLSLQISAGASYIVSILATALIAVLFQPVLHRLQRAANRLMFGQRDEPVAVLSGLAEQLEGAGTPEDALPTLIESVANGLKLPYAALWLPTSASQWELACEVGEMPEHVEIFPLLHQRQEIGRLAAGIRSPGEAFSRADRQALLSTARLLSVTVHALKLTAELRSSRQQLVASREEERRRIRRDLHDELGPALAAQILRLETAREMLSTDHPQAAGLLTGLIADTHAALGGVRRLVRGLRPPALDELGLLSALEEQVKKYEGAGLSISTDLPAALPALPAAVEVAAYRITVEALTNVVWHAGAQTCSLRLALEEGQVVVEVEDDGIGISPDRPAGVGLASLQERAAELGGGCMITARPGGGTAVAARLPYMDGDEHHP